MIRRFLFLIGLILSVLACSSLPRETEQVGHTTTSGFPYVHHIQREGPKPQPGDYTYFHLIMEKEGAVLFNSLDQPQMPMMQIPSPEKRPPKPSPIIEGLVLMTVGDSLSVIYPVDSLTELTYRFSLQKIIDAEQYQKEQAVERKSIEEEEKEVLSQKEEEAALQTRFLWKQYRTGQLGAQIQESPSGLQYVLLEGGLGEIAEAGQWVWVHYYGILLEDGKEVANTYKKARKYPFQLGDGQAPPGFEEAASWMKPGAKGVFFLPAKLGFGDKGYLNVPPSADLVLYLELVEIE